MGNIGRIQRWLDLAGNPFRGDLELFVAQVADANNKNLHEVETIIRSLDSGEEPASIDEMTLFDIGMKDMVGEEGQARGNHFMVRLGVTLECDWEEQSGSYDPATDQTRLAIGTPFSAFPSSLVLDIADFDQAILKALPSLGTADNAAEKFEAATGQAEEPDQQFRAAVHAAITELLIEADRVGEVTMWTSLYDRKAGFDPAQPMEALNETSPAQNPVRRQRRVGGRSGANGGKDAQSSPEIPPVQPEGTSKDVPPKKEENTVDAPVAGPPVTSIVHALGFTADAAGSPMLGALYRVISGSGILSELQLLDDYVSKGALVVQDPALLEDMVRSRLAERFQPKPEE